MGVFNTSKTIETKLRDVKGILADAKAHFEGKGFEVKTEETVDGGFISITKGGLFKEGLGLKSALNTTLKFQDNAILAEAKVGAFGGKAIATLGGLFVTWPLALTAAIGMVTQSKLDDEMIAVLEEAVRKYEKNAGGDGGKNFCVKCGAELQSGSVYCPKCGAKI